MGDGITTCSYEGCNRKIEVNGLGLCIFHYGNAGYHSEDEWKEVFWVKIRDEIMTAEGISYDFRGFIFPIFDDIEEDVERIIKDRKINYKLKENDYNFWKVGQETIFSKRVDFRNARFLGNAKFWNVIFQEKADFSDAKFIKKTFFGGSSFEKNAYFNRAIFQDEAFFRGAVFQGSSFFNYKVKFVKKADFREVYFQKTPFFNEADFSGAIFQGGNDNFSKTIFQKRTNFLNLKKSVNLSFISSKFKEESVIEFRKFKIENFKIHSLENYSSSLKLIDITISKSFELKDTNLKLTEIHNFDLSNCNEIIIDKSSFYDTILNNITWGKITKDRFKASRDTFRQLKHVNEQQGNIIEANKFYSLEMNAYQDELKNKRWSEYWQDKILFLFSKEISNFSQSWTIPLLWFFIVGMNFLLLYSSLKSNDFELIIPIIWLIIFPISSFLFNKGKVGNMVKYFSYTLCLIYFIFLYQIANNDYFFNEFSKFVNPFSRKIENEYKGFEFLWMFHKVVSGFIIYHFIVALRRQTRRK